MQTLGPIKDIFVQRVTQVSRLVSTFSSATALSHCVKCFYDIHAVVFEHVALMDHLYFFANDASL